MYALKMPEAFSGAGVESEQAVGEKVVADAIGGVKIGCGGTGRGVDDAANGVERHFSPVVCGAAGFPSVFWPGVVAEFAGLRNSVKGPAKFSGANIEGANIAGWSGQS